MSENPTERLMERTLRSEQVYSGRVVGLRVDDVELPGGGRCTREVVEHRGAVAAVPVTGDREVLMVRQWRHPAGEVLLEIPAGTLEADERPEETMRRELVEETGHRAGCIEHMADLYTAPGYSTEVISVYLATELESAAGEGDTDEQIEVVRLPFDEALLRCWSGELRDSKTVAGLLLAAGRLEVE
ncbi:MAG: NUDIX hydrolase [Armatimonadota bacterium]|nr:NUDIX hydrolase [Armatimonadota bacterium]